jgi:hypothetical protein
MRYMSLQYETTFAPHPDDMEIIRLGLREYNISQIGEYGYARVAVYVRDREGTIVGGLYGDLLWDWLYIQCLWVHPDLRSQEAKRSILVTISLHVPASLYALSRRWQHCIKKPRSQQMQLRP